MLSCNGIVLNYAFVMYNKSISKIDIVQNIAKELPVPPVMSYFLCDCWYVSEKIINTFAQKGFHTIGALKTNRMLYPVNWLLNDPQHIKDLTSSQSKNATIMCTGMRETSAA